MAHWHTNFRDLPEFRLGRTVEEGIARIMMKCGWRVNPTYAYSGEEGNKAPKALFIGGPEYVLPDLMVMRDGVTRWVEVKAKTKANYRRDANYFEHGVDFDNWLDYQRIEDESGNAVYLCIFENDTGQVYIAPLSHLKGRERRGRLHGATGPWMANWRRSDFSAFVNSDFFPQDVDGLYVPRADEEEGGPIGQFRMFEEEAPYGAAS